MQSTETPSVLAMRSGGTLLFGRDFHRRLEQLLDGLLRGDLIAFFCPHEPYEADERAKHRAWEAIEDNTWRIPVGVTAKDIMLDEGYSAGWTIYRASRPLNSAEWPSGGLAEPRVLESLLATGKVRVILVSDPDGTPWVVGFGPELASSD